MENVRVPGHSLARPVSVHVLFGNTFCKHHVSTFIAINQLANNLTLRADLLSPG